MIALRLGELDRPLATSRKTGGVVKSRAQEIELRRRKRLAPVERRARARRRT
jgi:hypothetical protein